MTDDIWKGFAPASVEVEDRGDGTLILTSPLALPDSSDLLPHRLRHWATARPDQVFLGEPAGEGWRTLTYLQAQDAVTGLAARLLHAGASQARPALLIGANSIDHAVFVLAAMTIGIPVTIVSPALVTMAAQQDKLRHMIALLEPDLIVADLPAVYAPPLAAAGARRPPLDLARDAPNSVWGLPAADPRLVEATLARLAPESVAKLLFTSGSTGAPKAVINTHRMLASNMRALERVWPFLLERPPVLLDWLPWHHTFGGNCCFHLTLHFGGSLYIDDGKPGPTLSGRTVQNLRHVSPTVYFNVPIGYESLLDRLEADPSAAQRFLRNLTFLFNAGAALPTTTRARLERLAQHHLGRDVPIVGGWGSTETAPFSTVVHFPTRHAANLGLPMPGTAIKLVPTGGRMELRIKGPNVTPGYWRQPDATRAAFDDDGFYRIGDAGRLANPAAPEDGILFDGRVAENFKLTSGTWVNVSAVRLAVIAAAGSLIADAVVAGHDRDEIGLLVFANPFDGPVAEQVREIGAALARHNRGQSGSSTRIARFSLLEEPPQAAHGEITDKGYLNQRAILDRRAALVEALFLHGHRLDEAATAA